LGNLITNTMERESIIETREVTILLSDLRGFTAMSETYPALTVIELLNRYFSVMSEIIITKYGGMIDKFMGDSIMVTFGTPENRPNDLGRALSCSVQMQIAMDEINRSNKLLGLPHLYMGIGVNTGTVVVGEVGSSLHSEYTIIGDEVNLTSRIEAYTLNGQILISESAFFRARDYIETGGPTQVLVKGKKQPVNVYELLAVKQPVYLSVPRRDRRRGPRIEVDLPFSYQKISGKNVMPRKWSGQILNIGYYGIFAAMTEPLDVFSEIKLSLTFSILGDESGDIYAKILNVEKFEGNYLCNIEFTSINIHAKEAIKSFVDRIIQGI
jgi:adenylate cyclase